MAQLKNRIQTELTQLKERIKRMTEEIAVYSDIEKLKNDAEARTQVSCNAYHV